MDLLNGARLKRAQVMERRTQVVELASAGLDYDEIAAQLGYANRSGAWKAHQRALATKQAEKVEDFRALEMERLDALQLAVWPKAMTGDVRSVITVLRIIDRRIRLLRDSIRGNQVGNQRTRCRWCCRPSGSTRPLFTPAIGGRAGAPRSWGRT